MTPPPESDPQLRRQVYGLLITLAAGLTLGRLASTERLHEPSVHRGDKDARPRPAWPRARPEPSPTFGSNDRSRFALARALVDEGKWVIGRRDPVVLENTVRALVGAGGPLQTVVMAEVGFRLRVASDSGIIFEDGWQSVDKVMHPATLEFYSTKPPLLSVLAAGEYWVLKRLFGWSIVEDRFLVIPTILVTLNVIPLILYLWLLALLAERLGLSEWGRYYVVGAAGFGTLVTPFLVTFNNHTVATTGVVVALYAVVRIREGGGAGWFLLAGLASGFTACNELPALALAAGFGVYLLWLAPGRTILLFLPAALLPAAALVGLNYLELGQLQPAYAKFGT